MCSRIQSLEETMSKLRDWLRKDRKWKHKVDERLKGANL